MQKTPRTYSFTEKAAARASRSIVRMEGKVFGHLTVIKRAGRRGRFIAWLCRCTCGVEKAVGGNHLRRGRVKSCNTAGHRFRSDGSPALTTQFPSEYQSWMNMRARCLDPANKKYPVYGGRGITVCERWNSFRDFMLDMGRKPDSKFTIERDDVNGNYEPSNCRWLSRADQGRNKRNSVFVTYNGKRLLLIDLVGELGLSRNVVYQRLKLGWTLAQAIALPKGQHVNRGRPRKPYKKKPVAECISYAKGMHKEFLDSLKEKDPK